ncbi:MAG TPA: hypothetical protein VLE70_06820 [Anaerolineae bacterium]|jgi:hypothetical protein|nr:hypothetical protein [Anaerolineae bacterium]
MNRRLISFGNSTISIVCGDGRPAELVDFLFQNIPPAESGKPWTQLRLKRPPGVEGLNLWQDDTLLSQNEPAADMAHTLMSQACYTLAYESRDGLLLHAAAVQLAGIGLVLPGKTGAGKSTLSAWLLSQGGRYLTDEMVFVPTNGDAFSGFARPLTIKPTARHLMPALLSGPVDDSDILRGEPVDMVQPESFGAKLHVGDSPLDLIVFPTYRPDHDLELNRLTKAAAAYELMRCLANARNLADHGLPEALRLANAVPAYALSYSDLEQAGRSIIQLLQNQPAPQ